MKAQLILLLATILALAAVPAQAQTQNRAGVVVQFSDGSVTTRCVAFSEDAITGYELLRRARLPIAIEFGSFGPAVCKIGHEGCAFPNEPCFCQCQTLGAGCAYWLYSQLKDGAWTISGLGAGARQVRDGDVDGWAWGKGDGNTGVVPVSVTLDQICSAGVLAAATSTSLQPTAEPSSTPEPTTADEPEPLPLSVTYTPSPSPSGRAVALTPTVAGEPTVVASPPPATSVPISPTPSATSNQQPATNTLDYVAFGVIALGLVIGLAAMRSRRN